MRALALTLPLALLAPAGPTSAEVTKYIRQCQGQLCPFYRAAITVPEGWVLDEEASRELDVQLLVPKGKSFEEADAKIYVIVRYNRERKPIATFLPQTIQEWQDRSRDAAISPLGDFARKDPRLHFERHAFEAPELEEQGFEQLAATLDGDKDGNLFIVTIVLSANSREALARAQDAYLSILKAY